jgi:hypothetical protein
MTPVDFFANQKLHPTDRFALRRFCTKHKLAYNTVWKRINGYVPDGEKALMHLQRIVAKASGGKVSPLDWPMEPRKAKRRKRN